MGVTIIERCRVAPPLEAEAAAEQTLPITFFDIPWLDFFPTRRLLFYQFPCSKTHFSEAIVPNFKQSLSQTLSRFFPLAANLINPLNSEKMPEIRYVPGDSVQVTVAESGEAHNLNHLIGNHPRDADEFYAFQSDLPPPAVGADSESERIALFTAQITLFPDEGVCVGFTNHHIIGDASSMVRFVKAWSSVAKFGRDFLTCSVDSLPFCDRSVVNVPLSGLLNDTWNEVKSARNEFPPLSFPTNNVRSTYILQKDDIQKLRDFVQSKKPHLPHLSPFTITTAYVWTCLAKSAVESGEEVDADEEENFIFAVDVRQRMDPPVPAAYLGNCIGSAMVKSTHAELKGDDGFVTAVELIGDVISSKVNKKGEFMRDAHEWMARLKGMMEKRLLVVSGSPKSDYYEADFGWGKADKYEVVSIDLGGMSLSRYRQSEGGMEIGFSMPKKKTDAFAKSFSTGLKIF